MSADAVNNGQLTGPMRLGYTGQAPDVTARRQKVINSLGLVQTAAFENWAFKAKTPVIYDKRIILLWQCAHSTKGEFDENDVDGTLERMLYLWKSKFDASEGMFWTDDS